VSPSPGGCHDIERNDFTETAQHLRLGEQDASTSDSMRAYSPSSRPSSESLHDRIDTEDHSTDRAIPEAVIFHSAPSCNQSPHCSRSSLLNQFSQEDNLHTDRSATDEHEPVRPSLDTHAFHEEDRRREDEKQEVSCGSDDDDEGEEVNDALPQRETNSVKATLMAKKSSRCLCRKKDKGTKPAERQRPLPSRDSSPKLDQDARGSHGNGYSDDGISNIHAESDEDNKRPRPLKRKRPSLSHAGPAQKKHKHHLQHRSTCQSRVRSNSRQSFLKSQSVLDRVPRVTPGPGAEGQLPSLVPSAARTMNTEMLSYCYNPGLLSSDILPTLTEVTFRPHSTHYCSFTAVVREGCNGQGVSLSQLAQLIKSIGHVGKIDDFTIKPIEQHSFLLTGFSWHTSSQPSFGRTTVVTATEADRNHVDTTCTRPQDSATAVDTEALLSQGSKPPSSDDGSLSDSDSDLSSNDNGYSSKDKQGRSSTSKHSRWSDLDEQRLLAYKKEGKSWEWIFGRFPGRTGPAIRTRWNMVRPRSE
jgi:hypothetical protein